MLLYGHKTMKRSYRPTMFGGHSHCSSEDIMILVCHVILLDHVIKGSCDFIGKNPSTYVIILLGLVAINTLIAEIKVALVCQVILQDHTIKGSFNLIGRSPSR